MPPHFGTRIRGQRPGNAGLLHDHARQGHATPRSYVSFSGVACVGRRSNAGTVIPCRTAYVRSSTTWNNCRVACDPSPTPHGMGGTPLIKVHPHHLPRIPTILRCLWMTTPTPCACLSMVIMICGWTIVPSHSHPMMSCDPRLPVLLRSCLQDLKAWDHAACPTRPLHSDEDVEKPILTAPTSTAEVTANPPPPDHHLFCLHLRLVNSVAGNMCGDCGLVVHSIFFINA